MVGWLIKTAGGVWQNHPPATEPPSRCGIALPQPNRPPGLVGTAGFWWFCLNREGETVGICLLGSGFGGWNCSGRE